MKLPAGPVNDIWYFYNTLTCTAYLDRHKILIILSVPLLDQRERYDIYKIHNLSLPRQNMFISGGKKIDLIAKYDLSAHAFMINEDQTKYALLSSKNACNN